MIIVLISKLTIRGENDKNNKKNWFSFSRIDFNILLANSVFADGHSNEVNIFSARHYDSDVQLYEKFTAKTGIKVNVVSGKSGALEKRIIAECWNS